MAVGLALLDAIWACHVLAQRLDPGTSVVRLSSLAVWLFLHLPAAALGGLILRCAGGWSGGTEGLSLGARWILGGLGSLQTLGLALYAVRRLRR